MKHKKELIIPIALAFFSLFLISNVSAIYSGNITIYGLHYSTNATVTTLGSNMSFNITYNDLSVNAKSQNEINFSLLFVTLTSPSTNNNTGGNVTSRIGNSTLTLTGAAGFIYSYNYNGFIDSNDYTLTATIANITGANASKTQTITIDNSLPTAPTSLTPTSVTNSSPVIFSATVPSTNTIGCLLIFTNNLPGLTRTQSMTHSGTTCKATINSISAQTYNYYVQSSDNTNFTNSSLQTLNVGGKTGKGGAKYVASQLASRKSSPLAILTNPDGTWSMPRLAIFGILLTIVAIWIKKR